MEGHSKTLSTLALVTGAVAGGCLLFRAYHQQQLHRSPSCQQSTTASSRSDSTPAEGPEELHGLSRVLSPTRSLTLGWQAVTGALQQLLGSPTRQQLPAASFEWAQSAEEVLVRVAVPSDTTRHQVTVAVDPQQLAVLRGQHLLLGGCLQHMVVPQLCHWHLDTHEQPPALVVTLTKEPPQQPAPYPLWTHLLVPHGHTPPHPPPQQAAAAAAAAAGPGGPGSAQKQGLKAAGGGMLKPPPAGSHQAGAEQSQAPPAAAAVAAPVRQPHLVAVGS